MKQAYKAYNELRGHTKTEDASKEAPCISEPGAKASSIPFSAQTAAESEINSSPSRIPRPLSEAERRINEFNTLPPNKKIEALEAKLRSERIRVSNAERELAKERENHKDIMYHDNLMADNLRGQIAELNQARKKPMSESASRSCCKSRLNRLSHSFLRKICSSMTCSGLF